MAELPHWQPLDGTVPVPDGADSGRIVALVASEGAVGSGWAPGAALDLARAWSGVGEKIILVDGALHHPSLHTQARLANDEGLSDAALFGLSVGRIARPVNGAGFFLITAGTAVADANAVAASPRWGRLLEGFREAGVTLLLFVRDGDSGCAAFLGSASHIVVLADHTEPAPSAVRDLEGLVHAVTGPVGAAVGAAARAAAAPAAVSPGSGLRPPEEWTASGPGSRARLAVLALVVVLLIVVLAAAFGLVDIPGITPVAAGGGPDLPGLAAIPGAA